jgi:hypothetical protein
MHRYGHLADADFDFDGMVYLQEPELLRVVFAEQIGTGKRGCIPPWPGNESVGQPRVRSGCPLRLNPDEGVAGAHPSVRVFAGRKPLECAAQECRACVVEFPHAGKRGEGISRLFGGMKWGALTGSHGLHCVLTADDLHVGGGLSEICPQRVAKRHTGCPLRDAGGRPPRRNALSSNYSYRMAAENRCPRCAVTGD